MPTYRSIHTNYGLQRLAAAEVTNTPINLIEMAVGDGNGNPVEPNPGQATLVRERYRAVINRVYPDPDAPNHYFAEMVIPASVGNFTLREIAAFDSNGGMFVVGNLPDMYKPTPDDGAFGDSIIRIQFSAQNSSIITLQIDPNVAVASQSWVTNNITVQALIPGGTTGQLLMKSSNADGDTEWGSPDAVNITVDTIEEAQTLAADQMIVDLVETTTRGLAVYIDGERLRRDQWTADPVIETRLSLAASYPGGTDLIAAQNEPTGSAPAPLERCKNLSDLQSAATARTNLGVYSKDEADQICPIGTPSHFPSNLLPTGWLVRNGAAISRTAYSKLFAVIGTIYGAGDGFNTFNVPEDRGGYDGNADMGRNFDIDMTLGTWLTSQNKSHNHAGNTSTDGNHNHSYGIYSRLLRPPYLNSLTGNDRVGSGSEQAVGPGDSANMVNAGSHSHMLTINASGATHARPNGRAYMPIIRAY